MARPFGVASTADGVFTRDCATTGTAPQTHSKTAANAPRIIDDIGVEGRIAGWSMCARIHSTVSVHRLDGAEFSRQNVTRNKRPDGE
jgi:hypothetical protein